MLTNDEIKAMVEGAFVPLRCVAEIWDYDDKLRFKVFDRNDKGLIKMPKVVLSDFRDEEQLREVLSQVRERVQQKGCSLDPWPES